MRLHRSGRRSVGTMSIVSGRPSRRMLDGDALVDARAIEHAGDIVDGRYDLLVDADDHVARLQPAAMAGLPG